MRVTSRIAAALLLFGGLAACAKSDDAASDSLATDTAPGAIEVVPAPATADTPAAPTASGPALVHVPLTEWSVRVLDTDITAGTRTFHAMNQGTYTHAFEIEGNGQEWKSGPIPPGGTATLTPTLRAGTYEVYCPIVDSHGNHQSRGMRTTFTVR